ncbi:Signal transduction histidine kinase [Georgenia satyanarayanai]|uniref:histidine kinase n=1 Tax=Georgenia satyanarayanai TaxID=860221 RepID=A0A2Y8ZYB0_9MICO|nr:histidine kinase [Georgenia satyanarayanai]PYG02176.1 signal transduction histidine kinase [Georgenia satyanarayanai]SSA36995.1 Signal transduction histidine kinase [Georgenia satyanarayanai]
MDTTPVTSAGTWWDARLSRLRLHGPLARDTALAAVVAVVMVLIAAATIELVPADAAPPSSTAPWLLVLVVVQSLALAVRRVALVACVVAVVATQVALVALAPDLSVRTITAAVVAVTAGTHLPLGRALRLVGGAVVVETVGATLVSAVRGAGTDVLLQNAVSPVLLWGASLLFGLYLAARQERLWLLEERATRLEQERDARVQAAVGEERARLARELHDVAAHHLSGMVVQAAAVERLVDRDPEAARAGAVWLRDQGRETLDNLRQVVGLLRDDDGDPLSPVPGVGALGDLVRAARELGGDVRLEEEGSPSPLPPLADVSVYRVAQQSVTNARQHAPGAPVRVRVVHQPTGVVLEVDNGPAAQGAAHPTGQHGGTGLAVMRERAALVGGVLEAGPTENGGWRVRLHVPVTETEGER